MYIPYGRQFIDQEDVQAVVEVLTSEYLTTGPKVLEFEQKMAAYVGAKYAVAVSNGTAALHIACLAAGFGEGDEVITSPITFVASANCVLYCGAKPVFADINADTYNLDATYIKSRITTRTRGIIAVHFTGQPCQMEEIHQVAKEHNLLVIEDAAHALGAKYQGKRVGSISDLTTFSFHPVKHITTGEGGMVTTDNKELYEKLLLYRNHGITRDRNRMQANDGPWYYEQLELGYNYRITDIQCALGISQLTKIDRFIEARKAIAKRYDEAFAGIDNIVTPFQQEQCMNSWHLYIIQVSSIDRRAMFEALQERGIGVNVHYIPVYKQPYYREHGYKEIHCANAEQLYDSMMSLPIYPALTIEEQEYVIQEVIQYVREH